MKKALIVFGSTTGNTEDMAGTIEQLMGESGWEAEKKNVVDASLEDLTDGWDLVVLGCPAYGDDTVELQEDFEEFCEKWDGLKLDGAKFAVFAPGDSDYEHFCGSVDWLEDKIGELGGKVITEGLKVDGDPGDAEDEIADWVKSLAASV
jgi:flavodoxin short chain